MYLKVIYVNICSGCPIWTFNLVIIFEVLMMKKYTVIYQVPVGMYPGSYVACLLYVNTNDIDRMLSELSDRGKDVQFILEGHSVLEGGGEIRTEDFRFDSVNTTENSLIAAKDIYTKYRNGEPLNNEEIEVGIEHFSKLADLAYKSGAVFSLTAQEANRIAMALREFQRARQD